MTPENKRITVNTIALYVKLFVSIAVGLFSSRIVLNALGVTNYGLYNVVGSIVVMINSAGIALQSVSYRYLAVELGKKNNQDVAKVFSLSINIFILMAIFLLFIGGPSGVYYINHYMNLENAVPADAYFVFYFSLLTAIISLIGIPYSSLIMVKEKFLFTSGIEIVRTFIQFSLILWMSYSDYNHLRLYCVIIFISNLIIFISNILYNLHFNKDDIRYKWVSDKKLYREVAGYSIWIILGAIACVAQVQVASNIINVYFGLALNAAFGIANQVYSYLMLFVRNLSQAAVPQIMKEAGTNAQKSISIVYSISKYSFLLFSLIIVPIILNLQGILKIWLVEVPEYVYEFTILMIVNGMLWCLANGFDAAIQASGKIRKNQIIYSTLTLIALPISAILFHFGYPPYLLMVMNVFMYVIILICQCFIMREISAFDFMSYWMFTIYPSLRIAMIVLPYGILHYLLLEENLSVLFATLISFAYTCFTVYSFGLSAEEKALILSVINNKFLNKHL